MIEKWKDIQGYEGLYQVSNHGRVRSLDRMIEYTNGFLARHRGRYLKQDVVNNGYKRITVSKNNAQERFMVHRLVAMLFIENKENKCCVNHLNGDKNDNRSDNLEWCTPSENERHSYDVLGKVNANRKLTDDAVDDIRNNAVKGTGGTNPGNVEDFMDKYNVTRSTVLNALNERYYV